MKKQLGQFMTTNYQYILSGMSIPSDTKKIIEPFVGTGSLLKFNTDNHQIEIYDLDPKIEGTIKQDTLSNPPDYTDAFVLTNPPYLAQNKAGFNQIYGKYDTDDLYKCFLHELIKQSPAGGIVIIPVNFLCSMRAVDLRLRRMFFSKFGIERINIFEDQVFEDTTSAICSIQFSSNKTTDEQNFYIYPKGINFKYTLEQKNLYLIGGGIYNLPKKGQYKISRVVKKIPENCSNLHIKCIDPKMCMTVEDIFVDEKGSERTYATLHITPPITLEQQQVIADNFNNFLTIQRTKYHSLFLSSYREKARKRITFELVFGITEYLLDRIYPLE